MRELRGGGSEGGERGREGGRETDRQTDGKSRCCPVVKGIWRLFWRLLNRQDSDHLLPRDRDRRKQCKNSFIMILSDHSRSSQSSG